MDVLSDNYCRVQEDSHCNTYESCYLHKPFIKLDGSPQGENVNKERIKCKRELLTISSTQLRKIRQPVSWKLALQILPLVA